ncbi:MAG: PspC domain-containing protein [Gemmatimonadota bacterium]
MDHKEDNKLTRSRTDRVLAGVLGGLARHLGWSPRKVRIGYVIVSILSTGFPGILVYLALWYLMPEEPGREREFTVEDPGL